MIPCEIIGATVYYFNHKRYIRKGKIKRVFYGELSYRAHFDDGEMANGMNISRDLRTIQARLLRELRSEIEHAKYREQEFALRRAELEIELEQLKGIKYDPA